MALSRGKKIMIGLNFLVVVPYVLVCLVPFLESGKFWFIAIFGLVYPWLAILVFVFLIIWLLKRSKWAILSAAALLLSLQQLSVMFAFHPGKNKDEIVVDTSGETLRVLSWNVKKWDEGNKKARGGTSFRHLMMETIELQGADILCLQEFFESTDRLRFEANIAALEKMGYPYHYFFPSSQTHEGKYQYGLCIFSKYPIVDSASFLNGASAHSEGLCYIDVKIKERIVRVFTTHLQSPGFDKSDYSGAGKIKTSRSALSKLKNSYQLRNEQAKKVDELIKSSPYPVIICSNLGDIPNSYAYFKVKGNLRDAFLSKGFGLGRTFTFISPSLRIDYIFTGKEFSINKFTSIKTSYSDHYLIKTDLSFKEPKN